MLLHSTLPLVPRGTAHVLGAFRLGGALPAVDWPVQHISANSPAQQGQAPIDETWWVDAPVRSGQRGAIRWTRTDSLLYGVLTLDEPVTEEPRLQAAARDAYDQLFRLLDTEKLPHLWRIWNYFADINGETHGLERYRQFNIGRQDAFLAHQRGATGNVPTACAIGLRQGPLSIAFLAADTPPVPIENPRQVSAYHYPADYGPRSPTFSRAALVHPPGQEILFISGTASIVGHRSMHVGDVVAQTGEAMANITAVLDAASGKARTGPFRPDEMSYRIYVRRRADMAAVQQALAPQVGQAPCLYVEADICREDLLVEIEAMAIHPEEPTHV